MLVILVMGITTAFITSLSKVGLDNQRNQRTADALSIAKDALIGRAVADANLPGSLPCPDTNNDGVSELFSGNQCPGYLGRLPWKSLGISDLRDGTGERLWYALTPEFRDQTATPHTLNSDTIGSLSLGGNVNASHLAAIVFAPGLPLAAQARTAANENDYQHYLESVVTPATVFQAQSPDDHAGGGYSYNDQVIFITHDNLMQPVEKRIAREVRACLDSYALDSNSKYPWAASTSDTSNYYGVKDRRFGRIAQTRLNILTSTSDYLNFMSKIDAVQIALNTYISHPIPSNLASLQNVGDTLKDASRPSGFPESAYDDAHSAGYRADNLPPPPDSSDLNGVQDKLTSSYASLNSNGLLDGDMQANWSCPLLATTGNYWDSWRNLIFYQVSSRFDPGSSSSSCDSGTCLTINGSGSYRAVVAAGRQALPAQSPRSPSTTSDYLEGNNQLNKSGSSPTLVFETYRTGEVNFSTVNDLVIAASAP
jgi:type II secretory pathway pseudopilin PulG